MYNQEIKMRFLTECFNSPRIISDRGGQLSDIGVYEERVGRDLAQMNLEEVKYALSLVEVLEYGTASNLISLVNAYRVWCGKNQVFQDVNRSEGRVSVDDVDFTAQFAKVIIRDANDLVNSLGKIRLFDNGHAEVVILALAWLGIDIKTAVALKEHDVDLESGVICDSSGRVLADRIPLEIHKVLSEFSKCESGLRDNATGSYEVVKDHSYDVFLKRFCTPKSPKMGEPITVDKARRAVENLNREYKREGLPGRLAYGNVVRSGALSRVFDLEARGVNVRDRANMQLVLDTYGFGKDYVKIMWQYRFYKKAFSL